MNFCTVNTLIDFGFAKNESYEIMHAMKDDYTSAGYRLAVRYLRIPMEFANQWAKDNLGTSLI